MMEIESVNAFEILDSRGVPTIIAEVYLKGGAIGHAKAPSGVSTGTREAVELRDGDSRYNGLGVRKAVNNIKTIISPALVGLPANEMELVDETLINLDGTSTKARLGANAIIAVSLAAARAAAKQAKQPFYQYLTKSPEKFILPTPLMNLINGGAHANNNLDFQEFMIIPFGAASFSQAIEFGAEVFYALHKMFSQKNLSTAVGYEGGFAPDLNSNEAAIEYIIKACEDVGLKLGKDIGLGLDLASSEFFDNGYYKVYSKQKNYTNHEFITYLEDLVKTYPILSIEDPLDENDWGGWQLLTERLGGKIQIVGDDLFVTNCNIIKRGIEEKIANSVLIKPNQIGTLSETLNAITLAKQANYSCIISHRSGDTDDTTIADLAVATAVGQIKTGSLSRSERVSKYNRLLKIESELAEDKVEYAGKDFFKP